jgi:hypothetical protein
MSSSPTPPPPRGLTVLPKHGGVRPCDCGCRVDAYANELVEIPVQYREESIVDGKQQPDRVRTGRRFHVRKVCEAAFRRELELMSTLRQLAMLFQQVPWWRRLPHAWSVYRAKLEHDKRLKPTTARRDAFRTMAVSVAPDWLGDRLANRWRRPPAPAAPATPAPAPPSGPR